MSLMTIASLTIHDVKNQLAHIAGAAEIRGDEATLQAMLSASEMLSRLLIFFRTEHETLPIHINSCSPEELVTELTINHIQKPDILIQSETSASPVFWMYDEVLIRMVLVNALQNALRYAQHQIVISAKQVGAFLEISVHDDGPGFPVSFIEEDEPISHVSLHGTGLGLLLARRIAALHKNDHHHGEIQLLNQHGALFILRLPA
ncbi:sensor histidine kinase [Undibacterium sp. RuRC25W]|uniref:sensor histidine kinase n=1 Tax=Undibacterium sp. RuRC25W TaxID=3413047 RepID=UPI003BF1BA2F